MNNRIEASRLEEGRAGPPGSQMISETPAALEEAGERRRRVTLCPPNVKKERREEPMSPLEPVTRTFMERPV
jgi:hypothetical protein